MGSHGRERRSEAIACAGALAGASSGPLAGATVLFLADALGGVVKVPGDVVTSMAVTGLVLACLVLPLTLWLSRRLPIPGLVAVSGGLGALALAMGGLMPTGPVFASATMLAGVLAGPALVLPRALAARLPGRDAFAWWQAAALTGLVLAACVAVTCSGSPGQALALAGLAAAVLGVAAICAPSACERGESPTGFREAVADVRSALAGYATAGLAVGATVMAGLHLMVFRWNLVGDDAVERLAWAALGAAVLVVACRHLARSPQTAPWLLLASATAPVLVATAPGPVTQAAGFAVAPAAACLAVAALDAAVLGTLPFARRPAAAALTTGVAVLGGLVGWGGAALLRPHTGEGSALTVMTFPIIAGALLTLRAGGSGDEPEESARAAVPVLVEVRDLSVRHESATVDRVRLHVEAGEIVALFGGGARVLLTALAGHVTPSRGVALLAGTDLGAIPAERRAVLGLCHLVGPSPPVQDERTLSGHLRGHARMLGRSEPERTAESILEIFPILRERGDDLVAGLPESDRRLLGLAEALIIRPRLLLVDAISPGLAPELTGGVLTILRRLADEGTAVLLAEPRIELALDLASRAYVLRRGRIVAELDAPAPEDVHRLLRSGRRSRDTPVQGGRTS